MKEFFNKCKDLYFKCVDYLKANKTLAWILIGVAALIVLVIVVSIVASCVKRSKKKKALKAQPANVQATQSAKTSPANAKASVAVADEKAAQAKADKAKAAEEEKARRLEVLARLEAEEKAAEAEELAKKQAEEKSKAEQEKAAVKATAKAPAKKAATKATTKTVKAAEKTEVKEEQPAPAVKKAETKATAKATKATESKPAAKKTTAKPAVKDTTEEQSGKYNGKWSIFRVLTNGAEEEMYYFELRASNGEKLLSSEEYTSYAGVLRGIETHKANIEKSNFKITLSKKGDYIFKLLNGKNTLLCTGENYKTRVRCESAIESTKRFAKTAVIDENVQDKVIKLPVEDETEVLELADGYNGKWLISSYDGADGEKLYYFELFANNGEKLLSSEEYTTYIGAVNGIQTHKTNIEKGNFRISLTKRGDYIYKLLNGNGQLLCLGEHYKTKHRCQNAVESVKRFAKNSPVLTEETNL